LIEGAEIPVFNKADKDLAEIDLTKIVEAWPTNVTLTYVSDNPAVADMVTGKLKLIGGTGTAKVTAEIKAADVPAKFENTSFPKNQKTGEFEITVEDGVAYIAGYDATGKEIRKTMFKDYNGEKYTDLGTLLNAATADVTLDAGWYYLNTSATSLTHNIRVKGDVNIILNDAASLTTTTKDIMDESAKQNYKLNFYPQKKAAATPATGAATFRSIKDFKEVNICGVNITSPVSAVENVKIIKGSVGNLTGTGAVDITNGTVGQVSGFATVAINKGLTGLAASTVTGMDHITTATIAEGATVGASNDITTLTIDKAASIGNLTAIDNLTINKAVAIGNLTTIGTADITETPTKGLQDIEALTLNKVDATATTQLLRIGTVTINKTDGVATHNFSQIKANALNISDGTIVSGKIVGFKKVSGSWVDQDTKVTMTGGKLNVYGPTGAVFAVLGDVEVSGGEFWAYSPDHHAVSGALIGTFEGSTTGAADSWTTITGEERPKYIRNKKSE
jgi:hypothetical protein